MKKLLGFLLMAIFLGCSGTKNQYQIEKKATLIFKEAYYQTWTSGVKGDGSGLLVFLTLEGSPSESIEVRRVFFHEKYALLKSQGNNKYQAFIGKKANTSGTDDELMVGEEKKKEAIETVEETFPFDLKANEAVVSFFHDGKLKYNKVILQKKEVSSDQIPR